VPKSVSETEGEEVVTVTPSSGLTQKERSRTRIWLAEMRPKFLVGSVTVAFLGTSIAWWNGFFSLPYAVLGLIGLVLWHISVQLLNDYFDYRSGVDFQTQRTPFSGGSGVLPARLLQPLSVLRAGLFTFALAVPVWTYLVIVKGLLLLPLVGVMAVCVLLYTPVLTRWRLGEISCGLGLGILPILTFYFIQTGGYTTEVVVASIPAGILLFNVHLLNEFPDVEADKIGHRKTLPIVLGRAKASWIYLAGTVAVYVWVVVWVVVGVMPPTALLALVTIPLAFWATRGALSYKDEALFPQALWANSLCLIFTTALLGSGYLLGRY
jgi:1,4-dihydroxy-2-naphthoate octaprenyltransferase